MSMYDRDWYRNSSGGTGWYHDLHPVGKLMLFLFLGAVALLFVMHRWEAGRQPNYETMLQQIMQEQARRPQTVHDAAERGDVDRLAEILAADPSTVSAPWREEAPDQPLHRAAWAGESEAAELLLRHGASVNARGDQGMTPLHYAAQSGSSEVAELLLKRGADIWAKDNAGQTPVMVAVDGPMRRLLQARGTKQAASATPRE